MRWNPVDRGVSLASSVLQRLRSIRGAALAIPILLLAVPSAHADCVDGVRKRTAEELRFAKQLAAHLLAALPAPPTGM